MTAYVELYRFRGMPALDMPPKWRWRFVKNGRVMANSSQGYSRRIDALSGCASVLGAAVHANQHRAWLERFIWDGQRRGWVTIPVHDLTRQP